ncbi:hypothetical protein [Zunongwangia pacifica]|uniref:Uncharacterized protein n=1 Tax=Zunongwangia pacifica TaxID=2911062 RepID=A0A9X1ZSN8_9FLAO|nr:hypothetical protein [Zunongwangia pacifica]MCL6219396.1 hypothetical protein [Zunongwangia pacifica]
MLKDKFFLKGLMLDAIGMLTMGVPVIGPFLDILWAPFAARKMREMYPGKNGKLASAIVFIEEILPFTDVIPTFTLMYLYTFVFKKQPRKQVRTIEVESW